MTQSFAVAAGEGLHAPGSEPAVGSVRPKQPIASPAAICGQPLLFLFLGAVLVDGAHGQRALHGDEGAQARSRRPPVPRRPGRSRRRSGRRSRSPSGACRAGRAWPFPARSPAGRRASSYQPAMFGLISSSTKDRTESRSASSSAVSRESKLIRSVEWRHGFLGAVFGRLVRGIGRKSHNSAACFLPEEAVGRSRTR